MEIDIGTIQFRGYDIDIDHDNENDIVYENDIDNGIGIDNDNRPIDGPNIGHIIALMAAMSDNVNWITNNLLANR